MCPIAAIFDVDRTLSRWPTERLFFLYLIFQGILPLSRALGFLATLLRQHHQRFLNKAYVQGLAEAEVQLLALRCYQTWLKPRFSAQGVAQLRWHQKQGHQIVLLTGSLHCLIRPLQVDVGADWLIATHLETLGGTCTGRIAGTHPRGENKLRLIQELAHQAGFVLGRSYAYADHISDLPLLAHVGQPIAVNPDRALKKVALQRGWPVYRF